jgi:hypothetical protein
MRRFISRLFLWGGLLAAVTFGFALFDVLVPGVGVVPDPTTTGQGIAETASVKRTVLYVGLGLLGGLILAWCSSINWTTVPARFSIWLEVQRRRAAWIALGSVSTCILLFF